MVFVLGGCVSPVYGNSGLGYVSEPLSTGMLTIRNGAYVIVRAFWELVWSWRSARAHCPGRFGFLGSLWAHVFYNLLMFK